MQNIFMWCFSFVLSCFISSRIYINAFYIHFQVLLNLVCRFDFMLYILSLLSLFLWVLRSPLHSHLVQVCQSPHLCFHMYLQSFTPSVMTLALTQFLLLRFSSLFIIAFFRRCVFSSSGLFAFLSCSACLFPVNVFVILPSSTLGLATIIKCIFFSCYCYLPNCRNLAYFLLIHNFMT